MWHKLAVRFCTEELFNSRGIEPLELSTNKAVQYYPKNYFLIASLREFTVRHFWTTSLYFLLRDADTEWLSFDIATCCFFITQMICYLVFVRRYHAARKNAAV